MDESKEKQLDPNLELQLNRQYILAGVAILFFLSITAFLIYQYFQQEDPYSGKLISDPDYYQPLAQNSDWHSILLGPFQLNTPKDFKYYQFRSPDNFIGEITNGKDTLFFEFGNNLSILGSKFTSTYFTSIDTINGYVANFILPKENGKGIFSLFFEDLPENNKLNISTNPSFDEKVLKEIFLSILFPTSDTSLNSKYFGTNASQELVSGKKLFEDNCSFCHASVRDSIITGPDLWKSFSKPDTIYLTNWITASRQLISSGNERAVQVDSIFTGSCPEFPYFSQKDIEALLDYFE